ncbi:hypothetical protein FKP32DRAFT_1703571, partial [Trametes sanguinea]
MVYIGVAPGGHGFRFMRTPNNVIFTSAHALFDETMFPKCPANKRRRTSRLDDEPEDDPSDHESSIPSGYDDDDDDEPRRPPQHLPPKGQEQEHDDAPETPPQARTPSPPPRVSEMPPTPKKPSRVPARERKVPVRPGNIYGEGKHPVQQFKEIEKQGEWEKIIGQKPGRSRAPGPSRSEQVPGNSSAPSPPSDIPAPSASGLAQLCQEGGVALINYLLMKAVPPVDDDLPDTSNVREWTYRDITRLPPAEQKE